MNESTSRSSPLYARSLRGWLKHLSDTGRLAVAREGVALKYELAAIAKKLDGEKAVLFPKPGGRDCRQPPASSCFVFLCRRLLA